MNRLTLFSSIATMLMVILPVGATNVPVEPPSQGSTTMMLPSLGDPRPPVGKFGTLIYSMRTASGNSMDLSLISATTILNREGVKIKEYIIAVEFENGQKLLSTITLMPDGLATIDGNIRYIASQVHARSDLDPMLNQILTSSTVPVSLNTNEYYTCGLWGWFRAHGCELAVAKLFIKAIVLHGATLLGDAIDVVFACAF